MTIDEKMFDPLDLKENHAINKYGRPQNCLAFRILSYMINDQNDSFHPKRLSEIMAARQYDAALICYQLKELDMITELPHNSGKYKYNSNCRSTEMQVSFERFLAEVKSKNLPIHLMYDDSPSYKLLNTTVPDHF